VFYILFGTVIRYKHTEHACFRRVTSIRRFLRAALVNNYFTETIEHLREISDSNDYIIWLSSPDLSLNLELLTSCQGFSTKQGNSKQPLHKETTYRLAPLNSL